MSEMTRASLLRQKLIAVSVAACFVLSSPLAEANPTGATVVSGSAGFATAGNALTVTNSANAIINWQGFSIGINEITRFLQPSATSAVLNRVTGSGGVIPQSVIDGVLSSNGRVYLLNPVGVVIGASARIDVAGLIASSLNLSDQDFLNGNLRFTEVPGAGGVANHGVIETPTGGRVFLIAPSVENSGVIRSPQGQIVLAAGRNVELVSEGSPFVSVRLTADNEQALNVGSLIADAGRIGVYAALVRNSGVAEANGAAVGQGGQIRFVAGKDLNIDAGSRISANGTSGGTVVLQAERGSNVIAGRVEATGSSGRGGEVQALGVRVGLVGHGVIDASGEVGGGTVLVGGDEGGRNRDIQNAKSTQIGADGVIRADARTTGDGGRVIVWADGDTRFDGYVSARGGSRSGNGGFVETSGTVLTVSGTVNAGAPHGKGGTWLLDPVNLLIDDAAAAAFVASMAYGTTANPIAGNDINFGASINGGGTTGSFLAQAGRDINLFSRTITAGTGSVTLTANTASEGGSITSTAPFTTLQIRTNGAPVDLRGVSVTVAGIDTSGAAGANGATGSGSNGVNGGNVTITARSTIDTGFITTRGGPGGNGGSNSIANSFGGDSISVVGGQGGRGGSVQFNASRASAVTVHGAIDTSGGRGGNGGTGSITVTSSDGGVSANVSADGGSGGGAGSVNVSGGIGTTVVTTQGITARGGDGGSGGSASITTVDISDSPMNGTADADGGRAGQGGFVTITSIHAATGDIDTRGGSGGGGGAASVALSGVTVDAVANARAIGGDGGEGGNVSITAGGVRSITTGAITTAGGSGGGGGSASVTVIGSAEGSVDARADASGGPGGFGGSVNFMSSGPISTSVVDASGGSGGSGGTSFVGVSGATGTVSAFATSDTKEGGNGGSVTISSDVSITTGAILTRGGSPGAVGGRAEVSIDGSSSSIDTEASALGGEGGRGRSVNLSSSGPIVTGGIDASGANGGSGGTTIVTVSGATGTVSAFATSNTGDGGDGNSVTISSGATITTGAIFTRGGNGGTGGTARVSVGGSPNSGEAEASADGEPGGRGGSVNINSSGVVKVGAIDARGGSSGAGGSASLTANAAAYGSFGPSADATGDGGGNGGSVTISSGGSITTGAIFTLSGAGGRGGSTSISPGGLSDASGGRAGFYGGNVNVTATRGPVMVGPPARVGFVVAAIDTSGGAGGNAASPAGSGGDGGQAGSVSVVGTNIVLNGFINAVGGPGGSGNPAEAGGIGGHGGDVALNESNPRGSIHPEKKVVIASLPGELAGIGTGIAFVNGGSIIDAAVRTGAGMGGAGGPPGLNGDPGTFVAGGDIFLFTLIPPPDTDVTTQALEKLTDLLIKFASCRAQR